jgi:Sigma 54 modulation/S30EA ribosomal protein C terminus
MTDADEFIPIQMEGDGPVVVREKFHAAMPMSIDQALLEMELVGHDFYLFRDDTCGHPSVVYRRHGYQYGLIRLIENASADGGREHSRRA